jgi:hypothetical protein
MHVQIDRKSHALGPNRRKAYYNALMRSAIETARGTPALMAVLDGAKIIGLVAGIPWWIAEGRSDINKHTVFWRWYDPDISGEWTREAAITTYNDLISALGAGRSKFTIFSKANTTAPVANNWYDLWPVAGMPAAGTYSGAAFTAVQYADTNTGAMLHGGNVSSMVKYLTTVASVSSGGTPTLMLYDRVLTYEACTFNASVNQAFTNTLTAQRYNGTGLPGLLPAITCQTVLGATASNLTQLQYTDQDNNTLISAPVSVSNAIIVSAAAPTNTLGARIVCPSVTAATVSVAPFYPLAANDTGVRQLTNFTTSAANTGTLAFVLAFPFAIQPNPLAGVYGVTDQVMQLANLPIVYDGACISALAAFPAATASTLMGHIQTAWN